MSSVVERAVSQAVSAIDHRIGGDIRALLEHSKRQDVTTNTIKDQVNQQDARITEFADRFQSDQQDVRAHIVELQKQVGTVGELRQQCDNLSKEVQGLSSGQVMHASPQGVQAVSRNMTPKGKTNSAMHRDGNDDGIDFCHLIFGGWNDARRNTIQDETWKAIRKIGTKMGHQLDVKQVMVYSARADVSHVYLNPTHDGDVKRALDAVTRFDKQLHLSSGCPMWISVHKPPAVRYRNKATGNVLGKIKSLLGMPPR